MATSDFKCTMSWTAGDCHDLSRLKSGSTCLRGNIFLFPHIQAANFNSIAVWWEAEIKTVPKGKKRAFNRASIYIMWNLWKRNQKIFQNEGSTSLAAVARMKEDRTTAACFWEGIMKRLSPLAVLVYPNLGCIHPSGSFVALRRKALFTSSLL